MDAKVFLQFVDELCKSKNLSAEEFRAKLASCGDPSATNATVTLQDSVLGM